MEVTENGALSSAIFTTFINIFIVADVFAYTYYKLCCAYKWSSTPGGSLSTLPTKMNCQPYMNSLVHTYVMPSSLHCAILLEESVILVGNTNEEYGIIKS